MPTRLHWFMYMKLKKNAEKTLASIQFYDKTLIRSVYSKKKGKRKANLMALFM